MRRVSGTGTGTAHQATSYTTCEAWLGKRIPQRALLDTCAGLSLIDSDLVRRLGLSLVAKPLQIEGVGTVKSAGYAVVPLTLPAFDEAGLCDLHFNHEFYVVDDLKPGIILGAEFIAGNKITLDLAANKGHFTDSEHTFRIQHAKPKAPETGSQNVPPSARALKRARHTANKKVHLLLNSARITVQPMETVWAPCHYNRAAPPTKPMLIESAAFCDETQDAWFLIENSLIGANVGCWITNVGTKEVTVPRGAHLTSASAVDEGDIIVYDQEGWTSSAYHDAVQRPQHAANFSPQPYDERDDDHFSEPRQPGDKTTMVDDHFEVGLNEDGKPPPELVKLLRKHVDAFSLDGKPGKVDDPGMTIPLIEGAHLTAEPPRRASPEKKKLIDEAIASLLENDIIEPSSSPTSCPVLLVKQKNKWRFCVDYRNLNLSTVPDRYPLQRPDDVFEALGGSTLFSALDAVKGYHQLPIVPADRWKTAFSCHRGLYNYKRIPFGLRGAPAYFQRFMDTLLGSLRWRSAMVYLDDIVIFSRTLKEHLEALDILLQRARDCGLKFDPAKCHFALRSITLLGRRVCAAGVGVLEDRALLINKLPLPKTFAELHHQLGIFGHYRSFIARYGEIARPLQKRLEGTKYRKKVAGRSTVERLDGSTFDPKREALELTEDEIAAIQSLKDKLVAATLLAFPDFRRRFFLYIDASRQAFAAAVHQQTLKLLPRADAVALPLLTSEDTDMLKQSQREDSLWGTIICDLENGKPRQGYAMVDGLLTYAAEDLICLPRATAVRVLKRAHSDCHWGFAKTLAAVAAEYYHPSLAELTRSFVKYCAHCLSTKVRPRIGEMNEPERSPTVPFEVISFDDMQGLPEVDGSDACLILLDLFTKTVLFRPVKKSASSSDFMSHLDDQLLRRGWRPRVIITDNDKRFIGTVAQAWANRIGAEFQTTVAYHHQANPVERYVQTAKDALRRLTKDGGIRSWVAALPALELSINSTPNISTGYAPFDLLYITHPRLLDYLLEHEGISGADERLAFAEARVRQAVEANMKAREEQRLRYNRRHQPIPKLSEGDLVWVRTKDRPLRAARENNTLEPPLEGPFKVDKIISRHRVALRLPEDMQVDREFDISHLQVHPSGNDPHERPPLVPETELDTRWEPAEIVAERMYAGKYRQFHVRWTGSSRLTWMFEDDLLEEGCTDVIQRWLAFQARDMFTPPLEDRAVVAAGISASDSIWSLQPSVADLPDAEEPIYASAAEALDTPITRPQRVTIDGQQYLRIERPIAFSSRVAEGRERDYVGPELELCGFAWAFSKFKHWLEGAPVTVVTDHAPLQGIVSASTHKDLTPELARLRHRLSPYVHNFKFVYKPGLQHANVDGLSRLPVST